MPTRGMLPSASQTPSCPTRVDSKSPGSVRKRALPIGAISQRHNLHRASTLLCPRLTRSLCVAPGPSIQAILRSLPTVLDTRPSPQVRTIFNLGIICQNLIVPLVIGSFRN